MCNHGPVGKTVPVGKIVPVGEVLGSSVGGVEALQALLSSQRTGFSVPVTNRGQVGAAARRLGLPPEEGEGVKQHIRC
jgi:hypothetical protein